MSTDLLYLMGTYDCEPLAAKSPQCGGPQSWQESEGKVLEITELYRSRGLLDALSFHLTPAAAEAQPDLYRSLRDKGAYIGIQPNVPGFRYPAYDHDLGLYSPDEQREIIRLAKEDFENALGFGTETYTTCCGSRSHETASILVEMGYTVYRPPGPGRLDQSRPDKITVGMFPFPYRASAKHMCLAGELDLLCIPTTVDTSGTYRRSSWCPNDLRGENPVSDETRGMFRHIIDTTIDLGQLMGVPLNSIQIVGHNTARCAAENIAYALDYVCETAERRKLKLVPISPAGIREEAAKAGWI